MSFPFYSRSSSKAARAKDTPSKVTQSQRTSLSNATRPAGKAVVIDTVGKGETTLGSGPPGHARTSSKIRIFPFLGKKRKSIAALRTSGISAIDFPARGSNVNNRDAERGTHYRTVSQLASGSTARTTSTGLGAGMSAGLPQVSISPLRLGLDNPYATPPKSAHHTRHSLLPSGSPMSSCTPAKTSQQAKRASDKPKSFLSRVTSRPALSFRYSSADLKSTAKSPSRLFDRTPEKMASSINLTRPIVVIPTEELVQRRLVEDRDFFTSPRVAPTPPSLTFSPPKSLSQESLLSMTLQPEAQRAQGAAQPLSEVNTIIHSTEDFRQRIKQSSSTSQKSKSPSASSQASLSPDVAYKSARQSSRSRHSHSASSATVTSGYNDSSYLATPRSRGNVVRIGREEVTLSVANVLETELGVDVGDSEEESEYGEVRRNSKFNTSSPKRFATLGPPPGALPLLPPDSSDLPRLCPSSEDLTYSRALELRLSVDASQDLEAQSPLSALMSGTPTKNVKKTCPTMNDSPYQQSNKSPEHRVSSPSIVERIEDNVDRHWVGTISHRQNRSFGGLDRISEKSLQLESEKSSSPHESLHRVEVRASDNQAATIVRLQRSLDTQCARFDKLARHLLEIIQRHTTEKLALETRITSLERDVRARDREIRGLRWLVDNMKKAASEEKHSSRKHARSSSMQSLTFGTSGEDKQADLSAIAAMLSAVARDGNMTLTQQGRVSMEISPDLASSREKNLRRVRTLPDMHSGPGVGRGSGKGTIPPLPTQSPSPDISGVGLGLEFPLPEPLTLQSIASTLLTTANSNGSVPALTAAPTAASGLSIATTGSAVTGQAAVAGAESVPVKRNRVVSSEKRRAGEWHPGMIAHYGPPSEKNSMPTSYSEEMKASTAYANNLNKGRAPTITNVLKKAASTQSMDFDSVFEKLVANTENFLGEWYFY